jgi:hypothetical protein
MHWSLKCIDCMLFLLWLSPLNLAFLPTSPPGPALYCQRLSGHA